MRPVVIIGCGGVGGWVAERWLARGVPVTGLVRSAARRAALTARGIHAVQADLDVTSVPPGLSTRDAIVYYFVPPPRQGDTDPRLRGWLNGLSVEQLPTQLIYISTTGVYGDTGGASVSEDTPTQPATTRGRRRLDAERALQSWSAATGVAVVILRVPGIYGPRRWPLARLESGRPVLAEADSGLVNRIHIADLASVCMAAAERGRAGRVYNVSDGHPSSMTHYFNAVADAFGLPRPPVVSRARAQSQLSAEMLSYLGESRRIDNHRMLSELGVELRYPDLAAGLADAERSTAPQ